MILLILKSKKINQTIKENGKKTQKWLHILKAFLVGGAFGLIGQGLYELYFQVCQLSQDEASLLVSLTLVLLGVLMTSFCIFDNLAKHGGAGSFIPIVGFANAMSSCAIEGKSEGPIFGVGGKIFSLVGSVFAYGIVATYLCGLIYYLWRVIL